MKQTLCTQYPQNHAIGAIYNFIQLAYMGQLRGLPWVDQLLGDMNFSLTGLIKEEQLSISFRNVESLSKEDIRNLLIKHYTLKFMNKQDGGNK